MDRGNQADGGAAKIEGVMMAAVQKGLKGFFEVKLFFTERINIGGEVEIILQHKRC